MLKRFQTFISSTYLDLKQERQEAMKAVIQSGCFPAGMELFLSSNTSLLEVIQTTIEESDIYILIIGGKYGSIDPKAEISYTEMEYNLALAKDKHILRFIHEDMDKLPVSKRETDGKKYALLKSFIARTKNDKGVWVPWKDKGNLQAVITAALAEAKTKLPKTAGWIQASHANYNQEVAAAESTMMNALNRVKAELPEDDSLCDVPKEDFASLDEILHIPYTSHHQNSEEYYPTELKLTWEAVHCLFLPFFKKGVLSNRFKEFVEGYIRTTQVPAPVRDMTEIEIDYYQANRILHHLEADGLIESVIETDEHQTIEEWSLTKNGYRAMLNASVFQAEINE